MSSQSLKDEERKEKQSSLPNQASLRRELLRKMYYPDTLYPDTYTFFTSSRSRATDVNEPPLPPSTTTITSNPVNIPRQTTIDVEMVEPESKYSSPMIDRERRESESDRHRFDVKRFLPSALRVPDKTQPPTVLLDTRFYTMKKTAMTLLCLLIIIMSNSVQLKHVFKQGSTHQFYGIQVFLGMVSIFMCTCIGVILMYVMRIDLNDQYKQHKLDYIDNCLICLLFIVAIFNIFIAACS